MTKQDIIIQYLDALLKNRKVEYWDNRANNYKKTTDPERIKECAEFKVPLKISYTKPITTQSEFIKEAKKHDCFGYLRNKDTNQIVAIVSMLGVFVEIYPGVSNHVNCIHENFTFLDGQPIVRNIEIEFKDKDYG